MSCSGDGITLGESAGGSLATVAWALVSKVPRADGSVGRIPHIIDRGKPGVIGVLADGKRFVNEAGGYYDYAAAMVAEVPDGAEVASWLICDHRFQRRYGLGFAKPSGFRWHPTCAGYSKRGHSVEELAAACGIVPKALAQTVKTSTGMRFAARIRSAGADRRRSTASNATRCTAPTRASHPSSTVHSMP